MLVATLAALADRPIDCIILVGSIQMSVSVTVVTGIWIRGHLAG